MVVFVVACFLVACYCVFVVATALSHLQLRSGSVHGDLALAVEVR